MDSETRNAIAHILINTVGPGSLPALRLTTLLYLSDWRSAITRKRQITDISWVQPFVAKMPEIIQFLAQDPDFALVSGPQPEVIFTGDPLSGILRQRLEPALISSFGARLTKAGQNSFAWLTQPIRCFRSPHNRFLIWWHSHIFTSALTKELLAKDSQGAVPRELRAA